MGRISAPQFSGISLGLIRGRHRIILSNCDFFSSSFFLTPNVFLQRAGLVEQGEKRVQSLSSYKPRSMHSGDICLLQKKHSCGLFLPKMHSGDFFCKKCSHVVFFCQKCTQVIFFAKNAVMWSFFAKNALR